MIDYFLRTFPSFNEWYNSVFGGFAPVIAAVIDILLILFIAYMVSVVAKKILSAYVNKSIKNGKDPKKMNTLKTVFRSCISVLIAFFGCVAVLDRVGLGATVTSIIATAGIGGLAIGFGAQSLVKDIITGFFLLGEQQISVGDFVTVAGLTGTIESIELRTLKIRAPKGELYTVPNGEVTVVTNYSRGDSLAVVDIPTPYECNPANVSALLNSALNGMKDKHAYFIDDPSVVGIVEFADSAIMLRISAKCYSMQHYSAEREIRSAVLDCLNANNLSIPYNQIVLRHEGEK